MTPEKQVSFIERVSKSTLGLEGLQTVVYCDRNRKGKLTKKEKEECTFLDIGNQVLSEIDGKYIKQNCGLESGIEFGKKMHQERVKYMRMNFMGRA